MDHMRIAKHAELNERWKNNQTDVENKCDALYSKPTI